MVHKGGGELNKTTRLLITVVLSLILLLKTNKEILFDKLIYNKCFQFIGKISFSIFIWHQIFLAFYRYYFTSNITIAFLVVFLIIVFIVSILTYKFIEKMTINKRSVILLSVLYGLVMVTSLFIYYRAGVVRDVPELGITYKNPYECRNTEYIDRIYNYDTDYNADDKIKILVVGNSFARDFACVLLESDYANKIDLSYHFHIEEKLIDRIKNSDYIFFFSSKTKVPDYVWNNLPENAQIWGIGTKNYGESNGIIYSKRFNDDYFEQTVTLNENYEKLNRLLRKQWGEQYIDFIEMSKMPDGSIRIFTPDHKFISHDCHHLTKYGAKYYASIIDFNGIFN